MSAMIIHTFVLFYFSYFFYENVVENSKRILIFSSLQEKRKYLFDYSIFVVNILYTNFLLITKKFFLPTVVSYLLNSNKKKQMTCRHLLVFILNDLNVFHRY